MLILPLLAAAAALVQPPAPPMLGQRTTSPEEMAAQLGLGPDAGEDPAIAAASIHPLGSRDNPVRVGGPEGERAYIARLRCADGSAPRVGARSNQGVGAFGSRVGGYLLECPGSAPAMVVMDMYHDEHREQRAPAGFSLLPG